LASFDYLCCIGLNLHSFTSKTFISALFNLIKTSKSA
jgi:hypothetical protein